jgi:hypothetical protein
MLSGAATVPHFAYLVRDKKASWHCLLVPVSLSLSLIGSSPYVMPNAPAGSLIGAGWAIRLLGNGPFRLIESIPYIDKVLVSVSIV